MEPKHVKEPNHTARLTGIIIAAFTLLGVCVTVAAFAYAEFDSIDKEYLKPAFVISIALIVPWTIAATIAASYFSYYAHLTPRTVFISDDDVSINNSEISITQNDCEATTETKNVLSDETLHSKSNQIAPEDVNDAESTRNFVVDEIWTCHGTMSVIAGDLLAEHGESYKDAMLEHLEMVKSKKVRIADSYEECRTRLFKEVENSSGVFKRMYASTKEDVLNCLKELAEMLAKDKRTEDTAQKQIEAAGMKAWDCVKMLDDQVYLLTGRPVDSRIPVNSNSDQG